MFDRHIEPSDPTEVSSPERSMVDAVRDAVELAFQKIDHHAYSSLKLESVGKQGLRAPYQVTLGWTDEESNERVEHSEYVTGVDEEDAAFRALFEMADGTKPYGKPKFQDIFNDMKTMEVVNVVEGKPSYQLR